MKPMELKVYERDEYGDYVDTIAPDGKQYLIAVEDVEVYCMDKRLTDAELAAEYHSWHAHMNKMQWTEEVLMQQGEPEWPEETWDRLGERGNTLHRFATLPHYDESPDNRRTA